MIDTEQERLRRWRLVLGGGEADGIGIALTGSTGGTAKPRGRKKAGGAGVPRDGDAGIDAALEALYDAEGEGGLGPSAPSVPEWLGDIRRYFPDTVVTVLQKDALARLGLEQMLSEPELLEAMVPDVGLVASLISMRKLLKGKVKDTARIVVRKVVEDLMKKLATPTKQAIGGALNRSSRTRRPRHNEIDWARTIRANLKHWQEAYRTIVPEVRLGFGRRRSNLEDLIILVDQSGSMARSVVYSSIFGAVLLSLRTLRTMLVFFDTQQFDLTDKAGDPVEVLFSVQLGGGTDIDRAMAYCEGKIQRPRKTTMVLISDLIENGVRPQLLARAKRLHASGVNLIVLLALSDEGTPSYDHEIAEAMSAMGIPVFACTPDMFPAMMAAAINRQDLSMWTSTMGIAKAA